MSPRPSSAPVRGDAPALRFLLFCIGTWVVFRIIVHWNPVLPPGSIPDRWAPASPFSVTPLAKEAALPSAAAQAPPLPIYSRARGSDSAILAPPREDSGEARALAQVEGGFATDRHRLRYSLMARLFPSSEAASAMPSGATSWFAAKPVALAPAGQGQPYWMNRQLAGLSLGGWLYLRDGSARDALAAGGQLGGSQGGVRLAYGFGDEGRLRAYGRATIAIEQPRQRELAFGIAFAPIRRLPVDFAIEQRVAAGREGRTALAALMSGGVGDVAMPGGFRLEAYAQAGLVGARRTDGFADGAVVIDHRLGKDERAGFRLGALAAGAVQPGTARVDVGPRLTVKLPDVGQGARIALDWRQRIAGDARPESGIALTLASDF